MRTCTPVTKGKFAKKGEAFQEITIPHTWNALDGQDGGNDYHRGECTYVIPLPDPTSGKRQYVQFEGANHKATVFCNGKEMGSHEGGFSTFRFDLTDVLQPVGNEMTVLVSNEKSHIYPQRADFTFFGGIYREVTFIEVEKSHFDLMKHGSGGVFITPSVSGRTRFDVFCCGAEDCLVSITVLDREGNQVASETLSAAEHTVWEGFVSSPHLWNGLEDPYCYEAKVTLLKDGAELDSVTERFGYRSYHADPQRGFFLNGKSLPLRGVCRHQDREDMGWAISEKEHREDIELIREVGANTIRLAHYQHDSFFYDLCDLMGFAVWAEIPLISMHIPGKEAYENTLSQMTELIAQNYNRPSILFWGIGNEVTIGPETEELYRNLCDVNALCKKLDPSRPTTMAQLARVEPHHPHNQITDLVSYNNYYGWYTGLLDDNEKKMDEFHALYPHKPYGISEYGVDNVITWHSATPFGHDYTEEYACLYHHHMLKIFEERPYLWATHMWNMFDFAVDERNEGGVQGRNCKGLITFDRKIKKDSFFIYQAYWSKEPMVHISGRRFTDRAPDERDVRVYTNGEKVTLFLNGKEYGTASVKDHEAIFPSLPLKDGENELVARSGEAEDRAVLRGVAEHNTAYDLPDLAAAMQAGNWFLEKEEVQDYGEDGYHTGIRMGILCDVEECNQILRGWIMANPRLTMSEKLNFVGRLGIWRASAAGQKLPREMTSFRGKFTEEDFQTLDKKLRGVKRK